MPRQEVIDNLTFLYYPSIFYFMINNKKKTKITHHNTPANNKLSRKLHRGKDQLPKNDLISKSKSNLSSEKNLQSTSRILIRQQKIHSPNFHGKKPSKWSSKKQSLAQSKNLTNKKIQSSEKVAHEFVSKQKFLVKENSLKGKSVNNEQEGKKVPIRKVYLPSDEYYGKKQEFLYAANTEETLNESSRGFLRKYRKLVNKIKSMDYLHKSEYDELKDNLEQHELMRLIKIQSLERIKIERSLIKFIDKN